MNEIRVLASVHHPNVIGYHDAFTERDNLYIVMEFAERGYVMLIPTMQFVIPVTVP